MDSLTRYNLPSTWRLPCDEMNKRLHRAVSEGDVGLAEFWLKSGAKLQQPWEDETLLWHDPLDFSYMIEGLIYRDKNKKPHYNIEMLNFLIRNGVDPCSHSFRERNFLSELICFSNGKGDNRESVEMAEILINSGWSVDGDDNRFSPLFISIFAKNVQMVSFLVKKGANVNKCEPIGLSRRSPLILAVLFDLTDVVDLLLSKGADINYRCNRGETALHRACSNQNAKMITLLIRKGADVSVKNYDGETPFTTQKFREKNIRLYLNTMLTIFSKMKFENLPISNIDMNFIQRFPSLQENFKKCLSELDEMASTEFYPSFTYYSALTMSNNINKLAQLTENEDFVACFKKNLCKFFYYKKELKIILADAIRARKNLSIVHSRLNSVLGEHLPDVVLRNLTQNLTLEDLPLE